MQYSLCIMSLTMRVLRPNHYTMTHLHVHVLYNVIYVAASISRVQ